MPTAQDRSRVAILSLERAVWENRQTTFHRFYSGKPIVDDYARGSAWGALATYDTVLSLLRVAIDGPDHSGGGHIQTAPQRARVELAMPIVIEEGRDR